MYFRSPLPGVDVGVSADGRRAGGLASDAVVAAFGTNLATVTLSATTLPLPTQLAGTTVSVRDSLGVERFAPLFFVSAAQINYLVPNGTATGAATVTITSGAGAISTGTINVATVAPGLFTANANGEGVPAAVVVRVRPGNVQTFEPVAQFDQTLRRFVPMPLDLGPKTESLVLLLFGTGWRQAPVNDVRVEFRTDGFAIDLPLEYVGPQPTLAGLDQINVRLPRALIGKGGGTLSVIIGGRAANPVLLHFK